MPDSAVIVAMRQWKAALLREERAQMAAMSRAWLSVERALYADMNLLAEQMTRVARDGGTVTQGMLFQDDRYQQLMAQLTDELTRYTPYVERTISDRQRQLARLGIDHAARAIEAQGVSAGFARLPVEAVENMVGLAGDGSPLSALLRRSWPDAAQGITNALIRGVALGYNPRKTARLMAQGSTRSLDRMMNVARTEQLRVYRESSLQSYRASNVVSGYRRLCSHDDRVCASCLADEGQLYDLGTTMPEHPSGRCAPIPQVIGVPQPQWLKGEAWLREQPPATQLSILGKGRFNLWDAGRIGLQDLITIVPNDIWGDSLQVTALRELV